MEARTLEDLRAESNELAGDAFEAVTILRQVLRKEHLSSDVYQEVEELIDTLHVRAGHAEGEYFGVENYLLPIVAVLSRYYSNIESWEKSNAGDDRELAGIRIATVSILDLIRRATGLDLWPELPTELDPEELESYFV